MTISEHLQFSVLTAPVACVDRRSLSQAWYSALYGTAASAPRQSASRSKPVTTRKTAQPHRGATVESHTTSPPPAKRSTNARRTSIVAPPPDRRAPRSILARRIERVFLRPRTPVRKAAFDLESASGRVQILLNAAGSRVSLVAICPQKACKEVAEALAQARYALASRGIELSSDIREMAIC